ncbi:UNVERIFIED_CONTAM: hypothetical protein ITI05_25085, partial [Salmonella enterica subsp. enterica serovar Weltevreden]
ARAQEEPARRETWASLSPVGLCHIRFAQQKTPDFCESRQGGEAYGKPGTSQLSFTLRHRGLPEQVTLSAAS